MYLVEEGTSIPVNMALMFVLVILASARTFRLLVIDSITQPLRDRLDNRLVIYSPHAYTHTGPRSLDLHGKEWRRYRVAEWLREGASCPWCLGYWLALGWAVTGVLWSDTVLWQIAAISFAANYVAAVLHSMYDSLQSDEED